MSKTVRFQTIPFSVSTKFECKYAVYLSKIFLFQAIQFSQTVLIQTIQFTISMHFSSILPIERVLSGATIPGLSGPGSDDNEEVLSPKLQHHWSLTIRSFSVLSRTLIEGSYSSAEEHVVYSTAPADWAIRRIKVKTVLFQIIQFSIETV